MSLEDVDELVESARERFISAFPSRFDLLTVLVEAASEGDAGSLAELGQAAHRLVGRAGVTRFSAVAQQAAVLEELTRIEDAQRFDASAAFACLALLRTTFHEERASHPRAASAAPEPLPARRPLILLADDDEEQRYLLSRLLHRAGFDVVVAANGALVLDVARRERPATILLDVEMPGQDGLTTARQLKALPDTASIPVMFLTGRAQVDDRLAGLSTGADDYVSKGIDPRELVLRVRALCARSATALAPAPTAQTESSRDAVWLSREPFEREARARLRDMPCTLVIVKAPSDERQVGRFFADQLRRRDLVGDLGDGRWALLLLDEQPRSASPRISRLIRDLRQSLGEPIAAGAAAADRAGARFETVLEQAAGALVQARSRDLPLVVYQDEGSGTAAKTVLLTDDDPEVTRITDAHLRAGGYRTLLAFDGAQALERARTDRPDAVVLDLMLPKRSGFDVLEELGRLASQRPKVVVLSARGREEDITRAFALGADDYMIKPFSPQELLARLGRLLK
jgi:two-component system cell cycle response regulator